MPSPDLLIICVAAFIAVFILLTFLALVMNLINLLFPKREERTDAAMIAAITTTMKSIYPDSKITKIEEVK